MRTDKCRERGGILVMNKGLIFAMGSLLVIMSSSGAIDNYKELVENTA